MKKNYNISVEDNGACYLIVINAGTKDRLVINTFNTLGGAWRSIKSMYEIETQEFTVGEKNIPVQQWISGMKQAGYLE